MNSELKQQLGKYKPKMDTMFYVFLVLIILFHILSSTPLLSEIAMLIGSQIHGMTEDQVLLIIWSIMNIRLMIAIPAIYTILADMEKIWEKTLGILLLLLGWFYSLYMRQWNDTTIFTYSLLIVASYKKDFIKILKCTVYVVFLVMVIAFVMDRQGILPSFDLVRNGRTRHAFGMHGPVAIAGHMCFTILMVAFLRDGKLKWYEYLVSILFCVVNLLYIDGRVALLCSTMVIIGCLFKTLFERKGWKLQDKTMRIVQYLLCLSYVFIGVWFMIMVFFYRPERFSIYKNIGFLSTFEGRFAVPHRLLEELSTSLFGNYFEKYYWAEHSYVQSGEYLFIDSSYARMYLVYGVVGFVFGLTICTLMQVRLMKEKMTFRMYLLAICAVFYIVQKGIFDPDYNIFPVLITAVFSGQGVEQTPKESIGNQDPDMRINGDAGDIVHGD